MKSSKFLGFIITHGDLASGLMDVSNKLLPVDFPIICFSNKTDSIEVLIEKVEKKIDELEPDHVTIFVDLLGGSCWHAAMRLKKANAKIAIITGVNVPLLVSFSANYKRMEWKDLLIKLEEDAKKGIRVV